MQSINSTVIRKLSTIIFFRELKSRAYIWGLISGGLYPGGLYPGAYNRGAYNWGLISGVYMRVYMRGGGVLSRGLEVHTYNF